MHTKIFPGWPLVGATTIALMLCGTTAVVGTFGIITAHWTDTFGWTQPQMASALSVFLLSATVAVPVVGIAVDRFGTRRVAVAGTIAFAAVLALAGLLIRSLTGLFAFYALFGLVGAFTNPITYIAAVSAWFDRRRIVSNTISASEIGAIPEFGLGEALQRVPGASLVINNGRGEAQFLTLRGLNPDYNSVTLDGIQLPSTEETRRQFSFDVIPSIIADQVSVYKTYQADLPSDAIGGVTNLRSQSAFDDPGFFIAGHADGAYWDRERVFHGNAPSGQGDLRVSQTFGPDNSIGALLLVSYRRSSNSLNSYSLPYSYYPYTGGTQTVNATALTPTTTDVTGLVPIPDRRRWYLYDNVRTRPGAYAKLEYNSGGKRAHASAGFFQHENDENRYSSYLNRGAATATFTSPTAASFATGQFDSDYDHLCAIPQRALRRGGRGYRSRTAHPGRRDD